MSSESLKLSAAIQELVAPFLALSDEICKKHLNEGYAEVSRKVLIKLARKRPSPLVRGRIESWVGASIYAVGQQNFLFDKANAPYMSASDLAGLLGLATSTLANKAKEVRDLIKMKAYDFEYALPDQVANHPMAWMVMFNGILMDARGLPEELQHIAHAKGLIPDPALLNR